VPIIPDEARTFGMDALFRQAGIYSHVGQVYEPVDADHLLYYKEAKDGQILEEGISEAGSMSSFIAAGTARVTHGLNTIPFFTFYSMFGLQRIGDLIWAAGDVRARGFLVGGTAGRTTLNGEGLQHQDGHSHLLTYTIPNLISYDLAFAYEIAVVIQEGLRRMYVEQEDIFYYLTVENEKYPMPPMPEGEGIKEGILKGMYKFKAAENGREAKHRARLFGSGTILNEALKAQTLLAEKYDIAADVWSVTSYKALHRDGLTVERRNRLHPDQAPDVPYVSQCLADESGVLVAASDYVKALPYSISPWLPRPLIGLGTDGFGRSDTRAGLRDFFEIDARHITLAALAGLARAGEIEFDSVAEAAHDLEIDPDKVSPMVA
jgi:pyruvate dehydrogenase E1 component